MWMRPNICIYICVHNENGLVMVFNNLSCRYANEQPLLLWICAVARLRPCVRPLFAHSRWMWYWSEGVLQAGWTWIGKMLLAQSINTCLSVIFYIFCFRPTGRRCSRIRSIWRTGATIRAITSQRKVGRVLRKVCACWKREKTWGKPIR